ncbi:hypothetical protein ACLK1U_06150 [Escherichia coli]
MRIGATVTDASAVLATDYKISFDNNQWQVTRLASNTTFTVTPDAKVVKWHLMVWS